MTEVTLLIDLWKESLLFCSYFTYKVVNNNNNLMEHTSLETEDV